DPGGVAQAARAQLHLPERLPVREEGRVVVRAARHVGPMAGLHLAPGGLLEIKNRQRLLWTLDVAHAIAHAGGEAALADFPHVLGVAVLLEKSGNTAHRGDVRTRGKKLQEPAARGRRSVSCHNALPWHGRAVILARAGEPLKAAAPGVRWRRSRGSYRAAHTS